MKEQRYVRDVMITKFTSFRADMDVYAAIKTIIDKGLMGAPVVDANDKLIGVFSEKDAFKVMANWTFEMGNETGGTVGIHMTTEVTTVDADVDLASLVSMFLSSWFRGLPVSKDGVLVGLVSRRDVLKGMDQLAKKENSERFAQDKYAASIPGIT